MGDSPLSFSFLSVWFSVDSVAPMAVLNNQDFLPLFGTYHFNQWMVLYPNIARETA